jgi:hypothetical protein
MDQLQSFGVAYHFEEEIKTTLVSMHVEHAYHHLKNDLSSTALLFRLLRGNGLHASTGEKKISNFIIRWYRQLIYFLSIKLMHSQSFLKNITVEKG